MAFYYVRWTVQLSRGANNGPFNGAFFGFTLFDIHFKIDYREPGHKQLMKSVKKEIL